MKMILSVQSDEDGRYAVSISEGSNVAETAFAMAVIIKCLVRDKIVPDTKAVTDLLEKYLNDSQYEETEDGENDGI